MKTIVRTILIALVAVLALVAVGLLVQWPPLTAAFPFPGATPLTFTFIASMALAAAASQLWVAASRHYAALVGVALDYVAVMLPTALFAFWLGLRGGGLSFYAFGATFLVAGLLGALLLATGLSFPLDRSRPTPGLVRWSFAAFAVTLLFTSSLLLLRVPNVIPWSITPDLSVLIGIAFLGAAAYFVYGVLRPSWANAAGQLAGFLAYDLVLFWPLAARLPTVTPEHRLGLIVYTAVITYSGLLALYFLFLHPSTRLWSRPSPAA